MASTKITANEKLCSMIDWLENEGVEDPASLGTWGIEEKVNAMFPGGILAFLKEDQLFADIERTRRCWVSTSDSDLRKAADEYEEKADEFQPSTREFLKATAKAIRDELLRRAFDRIAKDLDEDPTCHQLVTR